MRGWEAIERPMFFEKLLESIGAEPVPFPLKMRCCGGSVMVSSLNVALDMVRMLLHDATLHGAEIIATACPLCQINLECYQERVNQRYKTNFSIPVIFFTQLMGLALGIPPEQLGIGREFISTTPVLSRYTRSK
ncbi:MAG: heterodisulfide reductase-related iron-sulfur binding cluster [bacterium]